MLFVRLIPNAEEIYMNVELYCQQFCLIAKQFAFELDLVHLKQCTKASQHTHTCCNNDRVSSNELDRSFPSQVISTTKQINSSNGAQPLKKYPDFKIVPENETHSKQNARPKKSSQLVSIPLYKQTIR